MKLSAPMERLIIEADNGALADDRRTAWALVRRGLAIEDRGTITRPSRYGYLGETVYDALKGFLLTDEGHAVRERLLARAEERKNGS